MKFTVNMYMSLTCIIYCDAGCGRLIKLHASTGRYVLQVADCRLKNGLLSLSEST